VINPGKDGEKTGYSTDVRAENVTPNIMAATSAAEGRADGPMARRS
jgi:hypothetical protein